MADQKNFSGEEIVEIFMFYNKYTKIELIEAMINNFSKV